MAKVLFIFLLLACAMKTYGKTIKLGVASSPAPWVIADSNSGILIDLISEALTPLGYTIEISYLPYARRIESFQNQTVDAISDINQINIEHDKLGGYYSGEIYAYENYAYSLKKNNFSFNTVADLSPHSLLSWQGAQGKLGQEYDNMINASVSYQETPNQYLQVKMLLKERVEVVQMDKQIFHYYYHQLLSSNPQMQAQAISRFALFGKNPNGFLFHSPKIRDDFVNQFKRMKKNGTVAKIFQRYTKS